MLVSSRMPKRRRSPGPATAMAGLLLVATAACSAEPEADKPSTGSTEPAAEPTPLADYDTSSVTIVRTAFCDRVSDSAIASAVATEADDARDAESWRPGGRLPDSKDIGNEFGCAWTAGRVTARAWVFAPPVTPERAKDLVDETVGDECRRVQSADLGQPSVSQRCEGTETTGVYGLVGDAWVSCEIAGITAGGSEDLVGEWCVAMLEALRGT